MKQNGRERLVLNWQQHRSRTDLVNNKLNLACDYSDAKIIDITLYLIIILLLDYFVLLSWFVLIEAH